MYDRLRGKPAISMRKGELAIVCVSEPVFFPPLPGRVGWDVDQGVSISPPQSKPSKEVSPSMSQPTTLTGWLPPPSHASRSARWTA